MPAELTDAISSGINFETGPTDLHALTVTAADASSCSERERFHWSIQPALAYEDASWLESFAKF